MSRRITAALLALACFTGPLTGCTQTGAPAGDGSPVPSAQVQAAVEEAQQAVQTAEPAAAPAEVTQAEEKPDETALAVQAVTAALVRDDRGFVTEADFYTALTDILAIHGVALTPCTDGNAYFCFNYDNVTSVRLLTTAKPADAVAADIAAAQAGLGEDETLSPLGEEPFDAGKDVLNSGDLVTSFVVSATDSQDDQTLLFLAASAALTILDPNYTDTRTAFTALKNNLFTLYNNSGGSSVSWVDGLNYDEALTVPGNAVECWLGLLEDENYYLAITPYIEFEEMIDIAGSSGTSLGGD